LGKNTSEYAEVVMAKPKRPRPMMRAAPARNEGAGDTNSVEGGVGMNESASGIQIVPHELRNSGFVAAFGFDKAWVPLPQLLPQIGQIGQSNIQ